MRHKKSWFHIRGDILEKRTHKIESRWLGLAFTAGICIRLSCWIIGFDWNSSIFHPDDVGAIYLYLGPIWFALHYKRSE